MIKKYKFGILCLIVFLAIITIFSCFKSEKVYILKEYNSNGNLLGTNEYVIRDNDTIMHGKFINYNEKGIKVSEGQFINDEPYGLCTYYDEEGKIESVYYRKNSKLNLECVFYNPDGYVEKYIMCDDFGNSSLVMHFDKKGVTKYDGYFQIETYQYKFSHKEEFNIKQNQHLKVDDKLKYSYIVANIPNAKRSFKIENISVDNSKVKRTLKKVEPCQIDVEEVLTKKGKNTIRSIVKYEFNDKVTPTFIDTLSFDVNVN